MTAHCGTDLSVYRRSRPSASGLDPEAVHQSLSAKQMAPHYWTRIELRGTPTDSLPLSHGSAT